MTKRAPDASDVSVSPPRRRSKYTLAPLVLISGNVVLFALFFVWPAVIGLVYSFTNYTGVGGIPLSSFLRKVAFAMRFGEIKILLSNDLIEQSRIMMYRAVTQRVRQIAPFFKFDRDPYMVITDDGRQIWMLDGYTTTDRYPYSDPVPGVGNYMLEAILNNDVPVLFAVTLIVSLIYIAINFLVDLLQTALDPRIRFGRREEA